MDKTCLDNPASAGMLSLQLSDEDRFLEDRLEEEELCTPVHTLYRT